MADNEVALLTVAGMTLRRIFIAAALLLTALAGSSLLHQPGPIRVFAEGVDITAQIAKVPPLTMQLEGSRATPQLYDDHGGLVPWAREPQRRADRWELTPQILESGTYRIVAGGASAVFAVRVNSIIPTAPDPGVPVYPIVAIVAAGALLVAAFRPRRRGPGVAFVMIVAALLPLLPVAAPVAVAAEVPANTKESSGVGATTIPAPATTTASPAVPADVVAGVADEVGPPLKRNNRVLPTIDNGGSILGGPIGEATTDPNACVAVDDNTIDLTFRVGGCLAVAFRLAGETGEFGPIAAFWDNPPRTYANLSLACTMSTLEFGADLSRRLPQDALLVDNLNRCDYSYFTSIGAGQARDASTVAEGFERAAAFCDAFDRGVDARYTLEIVQDKCHRGVGQSVAARSGGDAVAIMQSCEQLADEQSLLACVDGAFSYMVNLDMERDSNRLDGYWIDPSTACTQYGNLVASEACARFATSEFYRRGTDLTAQDLVDFCASWGDPQARACALGLGEVQAVYRDETGSNLKSAFGLCGLSQDEQSCLARWMSTLVIRHDGDFVIKLCANLPDRFKTAGAVPCERVRVFAQWIASKSVYKGHPDVPPVEEQTATTPATASPGSTAGR